jgi:putative oxidoreductase
MEYIKLTKTNHRYFYTSCTDDNLSILGLFFATDVGCPATTWDDWIYDDENGLETGGNITFLEKEGEDIYICIPYDDEGFKIPDDPSEKLKISRANLMELILDWKEKVCKKMPQEVTITYENNIFTLTTSNDTFHPLKGSLMKNLLIRITQHTSSSYELGYTFIRISIGIVFLIFGYGKLTSGTANLTGLGSAMAAFGITHGYLYWGYLAALTEFCGGLTIIFGFLTRLACIPLIWLLIVALTFHIKKGDAFSTWGFAFTCLCLMIGFLIAGSGNYSLDHYLFHTKEK